MKVFIGFYGSHIKSSRINSETMIYQIGSTLSVILGIRLPRYTMLPPLFSALNISLEREAAYWIHFLHLKINQIIGFAQRYGGLDRYLNNLAELNSTLKKAYLDFSEAKYEQVINEISSISGDAIRIFNTLLNDVISRMMLSRIAVISILLAVTGLLLVYVGKRMNVLYDILMSTILLAFTFLVFLVLLYGLGDWISASLELSPLNMVEGVISSLIVLILIRTLVYKGY